LNTNMILDISFLCLISKFFWMSALIRNDYFHIKKLVTAIIFITYLLYYNFLCYNLKMNTIIHTTNWGFNDSWLDMLWRIFKYIKSDVSIANCTKGFKPCFEIKSCEFRSFKVKFVHNAANIKLYWLNVNNKSEIWNINKQFY